MILQRVIKNVIEEKTNTYLFFVVLAFSVYLFSINVIVFMDDVFIYLRVVKNITNGTGPVLNPGDNHFPVTSPLWVFLLSFLLKIFGSIDLLVLSKVVFIIFLGFSSYIAFLLVHRYVGNWAVLTPLPIFFNHITLTTVGGEIALVYLSLFGILWAYYIKKNFILTGLFTAAAYLSRGELVLMLLPIAVHYLFIWKKEKKTIRTMAADTGKLVGAFLAVILVWHVYYAIQFQSIFPNTLKAKIIQGKSGGWNLYYRFGRIHTLDIIAGKYYLIVFLLFGLIYFRAISLSLLSYTILHYYAYKYLTLPNYHWYYYDFYLIIPMFTLFGAIASFSLLGKYFKIQPMQTKGFKRSFKHPQIFKIAAIIFLFFMAMVCIFTTTKIKQVSNHRTDNRLTKYLKFVDWTKQRLKSGDVVLAHEIGIISYFLEDSIIRDLSGIASPDVTVKNINDLSYFVSTYSPRFIFFPPWLPQKNPLKYVPIKNSIAVYKRGYMEKVADTIKESMFVYSTTIPAPSYIDKLNELKKNAGKRPGVELIKLDDHFVLTAQPPFVSHLNVPGNASGISVSFGLLPGFFHNHQTIGDKTVFFKIYGVKGQAKLPLYEKVLILTPLFVKASQEEQKATVTFHPNQFDTLELRIDQEKPLEFAFSYWGNLQFTD